MSGNIFFEGEIMSFEQLKDQFDLINKYFWLYLQIRSQLTQFLGERIQFPELSNVEKH